MNGMQLALAMMKDSDLTEQQLEYASIIEDHSIKNALDFHDVGVKRKRPR
jgi:hypothetical protein